MPVAEVVDIRHRVRYCCSERVKTMARTDDQAAEHVGCGGGGELHHEYSNVRAASISNE